MDNYSKSDIAVLIIDMQQRWLKEIDISERIMLIESSKAIIEYCCTNSIPIIKVEYDGYGKTIPPIENKLKHTNVIPIQKSCPDAFDGTDLSTILKDELGRNTFFMMGVYASQCISSTGSGGINSGLRAITAGNVIADDIGTSQHTSQGINCSLEKYYRGLGIGFYTTYNDFLAKIA